MGINLSKELEYKIDLSKKEASKVINNLGLGHQKAQVILALDISGSMSKLLKNGSVQKTIERILSLALNFDDDGSVELFPFHDIAFHHPKSIALSNIQDFVNIEILPNYHLGKTNYEPVITMIRQFLGKDINKSYAISTISKNMGKYVKTIKDFGSESKKYPAKQPTYIIFITDGNNADHTKTKDALSEASNEEIFWQFVGIGDEKFEFLEKLDNLEGRYIDNANFFQVNDLDEINDNELYSRLLNEFPSWLKLAKEKNIII